MLTITTDAFDSPGQLAAAVRLAIEGRPGPFVPQLMALCCELMRSVAAPPRHVPAPLVLAPQGDRTFATAGGNWEPPSPLPAVQLFLLAARPDDWVPLDGGVQRLPAVRAALKRAREGLAQLDPRFAVVFRTARTENATGLRLRTWQGLVMGRLRTNGNTPIRITVT
jgi:hypothetical protein